MTAARAMAFGVALTLLWGTAALAQDAQPKAVGQVTVIEGSGRAVRKPNEGKGAAVPLKTGATVHVGDHLETAAGVRLKITLNDKSVLMLDEKSRLQLDAADFAAQTGEREGFFTTLGVGKMWSKVAKAVAGSDAKFEVRTERAVAGVRGTEFWVDAIPTVKGGKPSQRTRVQVSEGVVAVASTAAVKKLAPENGAPAGPNARVPPGGKPRVQVAGPQEISKDQWEKRFLELQRGMVVTVDEELWSEQSDAPDPDHAFARFVRKNAGNAKNDQNDQNGTTP